VKRPEDAFRSAEDIACQWKGLHYPRPPDFERACRDHRTFVSLLSQLGAEVLYLPADDRTGLDSMYVHDPVLITDEGAIILQTGKAARRGEGAAFLDAFEKWDVPVFCVVDGDATAEAGDMLWIDARTLIVGRGFRTNSAGLEMLAMMLRRIGVSIVSFDLPFWNGPNDVLHLQSFISLLDDDLAVVYRRLLPVGMFDLLSRRGIELIDVPDSEYASLGCNIVAIAPRRVAMVAGNPITRDRVLAAGCLVSEFDGREICLPGSGGPTCMTRPLSRDR